MAATKKVDPSVTEMEDKLNPAKVDPKETANPGEINDGVKPGEIDQSGSISEAAAVEDIPVDHPSVDSAPRKGLPAESNRIDFNDPRF